MKRIKIRVPLIFLSLLIVGVSTSTSAFGHGGGGRGGGWGRGGGGWGGGSRVGIYLGSPFGFNYGYSPYSFYGAPFYGSPYYSPPPTYYPQVQQQPVIYIERRADPVAPLLENPASSAVNDQNSWWYYCAAPNAYYPYINKCPGGWLRVAPQPDLNKQ